MVPSGTPGSFIAAARQCRPDRQRQHISAAYPRSTLPWQHIDAMRSRGAGRGNISPWCVFGRRSVASFRRGAFFGRSSMAKRSRNAFPRRPTVARSRRNAFSGCRPWQYFAVVRFRGLADGKMLAKCVPGLPAMARSRCDAFPGGDPWQLFRFMRSRRGLGREKRQFAARYRRHASETSRLWQDIRAMHPKSPANSRSGMHRAKISPGRGPFRCAGPSDHARRADLAVVRRLNEKGSGKAKKLPAF